jgi:hypothetical protein
VLGIALTKKKSFTAKAAKFAKEKGSLTAKDAKGE